MNKNAKGRPNLGLDHRLNIGLSEESRNRVNVISRMTKRSSSEVIRDILEDYWVGNKLKPAVIAGIEVYATQESIERLKAVFNITTSN